MDSRFAHLRQRDTSVSMLRVKMSRRRSQSQKENRDRAVNSRRQLDQVPELDVSSLDASIAMANMSIIQEKTLNKTKVAKNVAVEERLKQLERWKERKALEKEKERRELERKGVFKTGVYHPKDTFDVGSLPLVPGASTRTKETKLNMAPPQSTRVTRSMKQQQEVQRPLKLQDPNASRKVQPATEKTNRTRAVTAKPAPPATKTKVCAVEPVVRASRSASRPPVTAAPVLKDKPKDTAADVRSTRSRVIVNPLAPPSDRKRNCKAAVTNTVQPAEHKEPEIQEPEIQEPEEKPCLPSPAPCPEKEEDEDMVVDGAQADSVPAVDPVEEPSSFAPDGFIFQAPNGLSSFKFEPLTPRSADAFLTPSSSFNLPAAPLFNEEPQAEASEPSPPKSPRRSPPRSSPTAAPPSPVSPLESKHDVPYFRSEISNETNGLTTMSEHWEPKVEDESIPEEMRDTIRTVVGQARLLMKERFKQFSGLVDDCELGRGEKITTCSDLQGFWDMVYYQVEDVNKKFDALKEAESRGWVEEHKPPPRQRKVVKKPAAAPAKPSGTKAAAKSRLAAIKAAMKAKQQAAEAEKAAKDAGNNEDNLSQKSQEPQAEANQADTMVFDGGFFQVESPAKLPGSVRRSSRLSAAVLPQASPCSNFLSPRRVTRQSMALAQTPVPAASPARPAHTPAHFCLTLEQTPAQASQRGTPGSSQNRKNSVNVSLCFTPVREVLSDVAPQPEASQSETVSVKESTATPVPPLPSIFVVEQEEPADTVNSDLTLSPRLSLSLCKTPLQVPEVPEPSPSLSFTLSPCETPNKPPTSSSPPPAVEAQESVCQTPNSSVIEEITGLDFERYLQPTNRCSISPGEVESAESEMLLFTPDLKDRIRQSVCPSDLMVFTPPL